MVDEAGAQPTRGQAFGAPGIPPRWTRGDKDGIGTAYSADSRLWFTLWRGIATEVYFPTVDTPQTRDLQFLVTDGETFFHEERRDLVPKIGRIAPHALGFRVRSTDPERRYVLEKEVISSPHLPALLERVRLKPAPAWRGRLRLFVLCAPHLEGGGAGNSAEVIDVSGRRLLAASKGGTALTLGASAPFLRLSCGYVGRSDGWTDLAENLAMDWEFDSAPDGNVALTGELDPAEPFTLVLALGRGLPHATTTLFQALALPYAAAKRRFVEQWQRGCRRLPPLGRHAGDGGWLYRVSYSSLLAHEDKNFAGAFIASLSIPWGATRGDDARGGYHLVWTRDLVHVATGLLAAGNTEAPLRALVYLATRQRPDGGFPQNFWVPGTPYWTGIQLDEVSHPILLAWRLMRDGALAEFDPYPMVIAAAGFLLREGPASPQDRWEEVAGYSPSTLAVEVAAIFAASEIARRRSDSATAELLEAYADWIEAHLEEWTVVSDGVLVREIPRHYARVVPVDETRMLPSDAPGRGEIHLPNQPPGGVATWPAREIVDAGFLELVRYGLRAADDPTVVASVALVDRVLKVETPRGPCWRRYNHDGYGEHADGSPFDGFGQGRAWPLLTGERGHYELAAGRDPRPFLHALEKFTSRAGFLPEQVWDAPDRPELHLELGHATGSATPLAWAHAEYLTLLRSVVDGRPFDTLPELRRRYSEAREPRRPIEHWKLNHRTASAPSGATLRVLGREPFRLRWSLDGWRTINETTSTASPVGIDYADIALEAAPGGALVFTFYWLGRGTWEGHDYRVVMTAPPT